MIKNNQMQKIIGGQGTGKTKELIRIAYEKNATVVCETPDRMVEKMHAYGYVGIRCISYEEYISNIKYVKERLKANSILHQVGLK